MQATELSLACQECDLLSHLPPLSDGATARCSRCGAVLYRHRADRVEPVLALAVAGAVLFVLANAYPFLGVTLQGHAVEGTLLQGVARLFDNGNWAVAAVVFVTCFLAPLLQLLALLYVFANLSLDPDGDAVCLEQVFVWLQRLQPWSMLEVFWLSVLVAVVKLAGMAEIVPGVALWSFAGLVLVLAGAFATMNPAAVWRRFERRQGYRGSSVYGD